MKGRGNASWKESDDKRPYNITLDSKITFPGIDEAPTKKWSLLAEVLDHSLLCNRSGYYLAHELGIGQDTASADVWMNGEYQGCYTITPKTDSYVTKDGYMIEQDNYKEPAVSEGGDPQFTLTGLKEASGWSSCYNRITVKKMGDNLLKNEAGEVDESPENMEAAAAEIRIWLQDAWDAIRSDSGYNSKGKYYTDYIDIESFAKMYLMHEYVKSYDVCAGSILFHRDGQTDNDKLIAGPIWDLDNAMGSVYQNSSLGQADNRTNGDRRSGQGDFIPLVNEYKTSIYKTISKHADFITEVKYQYNKYRSAFDSLEEDVAEMISDIQASAMMNHLKVNDLGHSTGKNNHYYGSNTSIGSGDYRQTYLATTNSKTDWPNYAANLKTYISTRSRWFVSKFYDPNAYVDPANCTHEYQDVVTPATCTTEGLIVRTCPICRDVKREVIPKLPHDYQDGVCSGCGEALLTATITCSEGVSVTVYETKETSSPHTENADSAHPRDGDTGMIDCSGEGQINFVIKLEPGYILENVSVTPSASYKNLKLPADTGIENGYRLTKVKGDLTITVVARHVHAWGEVTYTWSSDYKTATAERVCLYDATHVETENVNTSSQITKQATCDTEGEKVWTAVFSNPDFGTITQKESIPANGHRFSNAWSYDAENHWHECSVCGDKKDLEGHVFDNACDTTCNTCGYRRTITHDYADTWSYDAESHWHECSVCGEKKDVEGHVFDNGYDSTCNICGCEREIPPMITLQPVDMTAAENATVKVKVEAAGTNLSYQWQYSVNNGGSWNNSTMTGCRTAEMTIPVKGQRNGYRYRCIVSNDCGTATSSPAKLTVSGVAPVIRSQTKAITASPNVTVWFKVDVAGTGLNIRWEYSQDGGKTWHDSTMFGYDTTELRIPVTEHRNGYLYRFVAFNDYGTAVSSPAKLTVSGVAPVIRDQTKALTSAPNVAVTFKVTAAGTGLKYKWQYSMDNGASWSDSSMDGYNTAEMKVPVSAHRNGYLYRCTVSNDYGTASSSPAKLTVSGVAPAIRSQTKAIISVENTTVTFKVAAAGTGLKYKWQYSMDSGKTWNDSTMTGFGTAEMKVPVISRRNGYLYRCIVTNSYGTATSAPAKLTVTTGKPSGSTEIM